MSMRGTMKTKLFCFLSLVVASGCASISSSPPELSLRTLRISEKVPGFEYQYEVCTKMFLGICRKSEMRVEYFDLTNTEVRLRLLNMGFVGRVRDRVLP